MIERRRKADRKKEKNGERMRERRKKDDRKKEKGERMTLRG